MARLQRVLAALDNNKDKLVIDLSCRRRDDRWFVATNKWQTMTDFELNKGAPHATSIHAPTDTTQTALRCLSHIAPSS